MPKSIKLKKIQIKDLEKGDVVIDGNKTGIVTKVGTTWRRSLIKVKIYYYYKDFFLIEEEKVYKGFETLDWTNKLVMPDEM